MAKPIEQQSASILLIEDHAITASGMRQLIETETKHGVVGVADMPDEGIQLARSLSPDLVILDLALPGKSGIEILRQIREFAPLQRILIVSGQNSALAFHRAKQSDASGVASKSDKPATLIIAIEQVLKQKDSAQYLSPVVKELLLPYERGESGELTRREREILAHVASGNSGQHIAGELGISYLTVRKHRENLMRKLGVSSVADATRVAIELGLVDDL